jgi:hypothetical protein
LVVPRVPRRKGSRSRLLGRKKVKKVERSEAPLRTAFFRMVAELNDLREVTGVAEWRFREQLIPLLLNQNQWGSTTTAGGEFTNNRLGDQTYGQPK